MISVELPTGTVALLFSDIEGSTRLVQRLGEDAYAAALAECRRLLRRAVVEHGGCEVDCRADELFAVFPSAGGGVAAAVAMQRAVAAASWPDDGVVRVRIGLNVGDPVVADDVYVGLAVNRAARICSAGHGGQVLVSHTVRDVVGDAYEFRALGSYTLAGLPAPEPIFQVVISGARLEFPHFASIRPRMQAVLGWGGCAGQRQCQRLATPRGWHESICPRSASTYGCRWVSWAELSSRQNARLSAPMAC